MGKSAPGFKSIKFNGVIVGKVATTGDFEQDAAAARRLLKEKGLDEEISVAQYIFNQAQSFATAAAYIYKKDLMRSPRNGSTIAPFVVNCTFSIELYLKALAQKHNVPLRGHELVKLYQALPEAALSDIQVVIPACASQRNLIAPNIENYLNSLNNAFVEWRYAYEFEKLGVVQIEPTLFVANVLFEAFRVPKNT